MVIPLLAGIGLLAARFAPRIIPLATRAIRFFAAKPLKRVVAPIAITGFVAGAPTAREALFRSPVSLFKTTKRAGQRFETALEEEAKKQPKGAVQKALEIGGIAGIAAAGGIIAARKIRRQRAIAGVAAVTVPSLAIPPTVSQLVPAQAGALPAGQLPAAIEVPTAVREPVKVKRKAPIRKPTPSLNPVFINQIQVSN